jgi:predicted kinase
MTREEFGRREESCKDLIWELSTDLLSRGIDVILDYGFRKRAERDAYRQLARQARCEAKLYVLDVPREQLRQRLKRRNADPRGKHFEITEAMFKILLPSFELPTEEEGERVVGG